MKTGSVSVLALLICVPATAVVAGEQPSRYDVIIARQPFRRPRPRIQTEIQASGKLGEPLAVPLFTEQLRMKAVTKWRGESWVGFTHTEGRRRKHYFLRVGETADGITVLAADFTRARAFLRKNGRNGWISMK